MLNVVYAHITEEMDADQLQEFDRSLELPFPHEMTPAELAREERRRKAVEIGAIQGTRQALDAFQLQRGQVHR